MQIFAYDPFRHAEAVFQLWSRTLGSTYPVDRETFLAHTLACLLGRPTGAFVALARAEIIGFALTACGGESGFLEALLVAPEQQRQGVGKSLLAHAEEQLRQEGCRKLWVGRGADRFWTALPQDLPNAAAFFAATGFVAQNEVCDLVVDLREDGPPVYQDRLRDAGAEIVPCTRGMLPEVLDFEQAEFPGWVTGILRFAPPRARRPTCWWCARRPRSSAPSTPSRPGPGSLAPIWSGAPPSPVPSAATAR